MREAVLLRSRVSPRKAYTGLSLTSSFVPLFSLDILPFESEEGKLGRGNESIGAAEAQVLLDQHDIFTVDLGGYYIIDAAGLLSPEPHNLGSNNFEAPQHQLSAHDGIIAI